MGLTIQVYIKLYRHDLAQKALAELKKWADDAAIAQLIETWVALSSGQPDANQQAFYVFEELIASYGPTSKLLNGQACCQMLRGMYDEAESLLKTALSSVTLD